MNRASRRNRFSPRVLITETIWVLVVFATGVLLRNDERLFSMSTIAALSIWWSFQVLSQLIAEWIDRERGAWEYVFLTFADRIRKPILMLWLILLIFAGSQGIRFFILMTLQTVASCWVILERRVRQRIAVETLVSAWIRFFAFVYVILPR